MIDTFVQRIREAQSGEMSENSGLMASFKERLALGEVSIHHHHSEYQPSKNATVHQDHSHHSKSTGDYQHNHVHNFYKHIGHPNGPRTMIDQGVCSCFMSQIPEEIVEVQRQSNKTKNKSV